MVNNNLELRKEMQNLIEKFTALFQKLDEYMRAMERVIEDSDEQGEDILKKWND